MLSDLTGWLHTSFTGLVHWVELHPYWAYLLVFLTACLESLAVVGLFLPGTVLMFTIGAFIATDALAFWPTCLWAALGAVVGDGMSFWLGRYFHQRLRVIWPFRRYPALLNHGVDFFHRHGGKSVVFARFIGPVRPFLPAVAGMLDMPAPRFFLVNILSALVWAPAYLLPGVVFGASLSLAAEVAGRLVILILLVAAMIWFSLWLIHRLANLIQPHLANWIDRVLTWSRRHPRLRPMAGALLEPDHPEARGLALWSLLLLLSSAALGLLLSQPLIGIDHWVNAGLQGLRSPTADRIFVALTSSGDSPVVFASFTILLTWLAWRGYRKAAGHWLFAVLIAYGLAQGLKFALQIQRPASLADGISAFAFPSVHTTLATTLYGFLAILIAREVSVERRWIPYSLATLPIVLIAFSRLYLGVHWLSDVAGGLALGLATVALFGVAYRRHPAAALPWRTLLGLFLAVHLTLASVYTGLQLDRALTRYAPSTDLHPISTRSWLEGGWQRLPADRLDLAGASRHPLNIQYLGRLELLQQYLQDRGWHRPEPVTLANMMLWLSPQTPVNRLPVLPQLHDGHYETLRLIKSADDNHLWVLRLWRSDWERRNATAPLWIGSISALTPTRRFDYMAYLKTVYDPRAQESLRDDLLDFFRIEMQKREAKGEGQEVILVTPVESKARTKEPMHPSGYADSPSTPADAEPDRPSPATAVWSPTAGEGSRSGALSPSPGRSSSAAGG